MITMPGGITAAAEEHQASENKKMLTLKQGTN
jgi:hypothetical protein